MTDRLNPGSRVLITVVVLALLSVVWAPESGAVGSGSLLVSQAELAELPTSGSAWQDLKSDADGSWGSVDLVDQDNKHDVHVLAGALVYARIGGNDYRNRVIDALEQVRVADTGRVLALGRQLGAYVLAADLVGYRDPAFVAWVDDIRTRDIGGHGRWYALTQTAEDTANNWGTFAAASRVAASLYLGDTNDVADAAQVFRRWLGDTSVNHTFNTTSSFDSSWACDPGDGWSPVNPPDCGPARDGALVEDISRGPSYPNAADAGISYSIEAMQGALLQALLLERAGYPDVWQWENQALRRAGDFLDRQDAWPGDSGVDHHVPWILNHQYGTNYPTVDAGVGRLLGYTDWLYGTTTTAPPTTTTTLPPTTTTTTVPPIIEPPAASPHVGVFPEGFVGALDGRAGRWSTVDEDGSVRTIHYGLPDDLPLSCDWNGDGTRTVGVFRPSEARFYLRNSNTLGFADLEFHFGVPGDLPLCGDWDGDGRDTIGVYRPSEGKFYIRNANSLGFADATIDFGERGDVPYAGDWDGNGTSTVAMYRPSRSYLYATHSNTNPTTDFAIYYGIPGDRLLVGDWDADGTETVGVYRPSDGKFYLRNTNTFGFADLVVGYE